MKHRFFKTKFLAAKRQANHHWLMKPTLCFIAAFFLAAFFSGDTQIPKAAGTPTHGDAELENYFRNEVGTLSSNCLANINSLDDWKSKRAEYRRQLQEMLGLWPMPEKTDLKAVVTGIITNADFTVEKIYFQASPKLYCTANLYLPKNLSSPAPAILYECGHWSFKTNSVSYGNKAVYQDDGEWFARNGYVCLVLDTVLAGEIQGIHTGTRDHGLWWWNSRGYTPAGIEAWFGIRALDYLCTRRKWTRTVSASRDIPAAVPTVGQLRRSMTASKPPRRSRAWRMREAAHARRRDRQPLRL